MMHKKIEIGYHASHEQFSPADLLMLAVRAEGAGFDCIMSADHLSPWSEAQGESGNTWVWLGAALQATKHINFGTMAIPCGWRYHPVIVTHMTATLAQMFPGRLAWIAAGSGEALNETTVSPVWPAKNERNERLRDGVNIIRALLNGATINQYDKGIHFVRNAKIWSLPSQGPLLMVAALSLETAAYVAPWADGLMTVYSTKEQFIKIKNEFINSGGYGKKVYVQLHVSWHPQYDTAVANGMNQWKNNLIPYGLSAELKTPDDFDRASQDITKDDLEAQVFIGTQHIYFIDLINECIGAGADGIMVHNIGKNQEEFIDFFGREVLPAFI